MLEFAEGPPGAAHCGLAVQYVDERGAMAPGEEEGGAPDREPKVDADLTQAVSAWLIARGARSINLRRIETDEPLATGPISPAQLGVAPELVFAGPLISICPSNAEALWALGCFDRVIACEDSSDFPLEVQRCERLGPDLGPDLDRIAELLGATPGGLVVSSLSVPGMERNVTGLHARGVAQIVLAPRSIADVLHELERLGHALGVEDRAAAVIADMREQIAALGRTPPHRRARVYLEWWPRPMFTPGADCYSNELIALAGGVNVFGDRPGSSVQIEPAELLAADPEVCFVSWCGVAADKLDVRRLIERPGLEQLAAGRAGRVFPLDERFAGRPGPRMLEAARVMAEHIRRSQ